MSNNNNQGASSSDSSSNQVRYVEIVASVAGGAVLLALIYKILTSSEISVEIALKGVKMVVKGSVLLEVSDEFNMDEFTEYLMAHTSMYGNHDQISLKVIGNDPYGILKRTCLSTAREDSIRDKRDVNIIVKSYEEIEKHCQAKGKIDLRHSKGYVVSMINSNNVLHANYRVSAMQVDYLKFKSSDDVERRRIVKTMRESNLVNVIESEDMEDLNFD